MGSLMKVAIVALTGLAIAVLLAANVYQNHSRFHRPLITTPYQAVVLENGAVFYGRIHHLGTDYPVLRDAFSIRYEAGADGQPRYVVMKRTDEVNGADHMIIAATAIAFVEPVRPDSIIGRLITQARQEGR